MYAHLIKKLYPRYRKHLEQKTLDRFWMELSRKDFRDHDLKQKTRKIRSLKQGLRNHHQFRQRIDEHRKVRNLTRQIEQLSFSSNTEMEIDSFIDYEDHDDAFYQSQFTSLKLQLMMYNDNLEDELHLMEEYGRENNLWPFNALKSYVQVLQSLNDMEKLKQSLVAPLIAGYFDKVFLNFQESHNEPDLIALEHNTYKYYDMILFKICDEDVFDLSLIEKWKDLYGWGIKIILLDLNTVMDFSLVYQNKIKTVKVWNRYDLIKLLVDGELGLGMDYKYYSFDDPEFNEIIFDKEVKKPESLKKNLKKIDLGLGRLSLN